MSNGIIEIKALKKSFAQNHVLCGINLSINEGDVTVLLGPSGSGKTTLLRCVNFLEKADSGNLRIDDIDVDLQKAKKQDVLAIRRKTAMVFQNYALFANKTAGENIMEGLLVSKKMNRDEAHSIAKDMLEKVGLGERFDAKPFELSGGQQQRIGIARALALNPRVILFDEPTSALDPEMVDDILGVIRCVAESGVTMIIVTHEMQFAYDIATNIVFMDKGVVVEHGAPKEVFDNPKEERTKQFLSRFNLARDAEYYI
jgi:L-cystine transport system ATP-binding protein